MTDETKPEQQPTLLRQLCGALEDMSVWKDDVKINEVRARLEPAISQSEAEIADLRSRLNRSVAQHTEDESRRYKLEARVEDLRRIKALAQDVEALKAEKERIRTEARRELAEKLLTFKGRGSLIYVHEDFLRAFTSAEPPQKTNMRKEGGADGRVSDGLARDLGDGDVSGSGESHVTEGEGDTADKAMAGEAQEKVGGETRLTTGSESSPDGKRVADQSPSPLTRERAESWRKEGDADEGGTATSHVAAGETGSGEPHPLGGEDSSEASTATTPVSPVLTREQAERIYTELSDLNPLRERKFYIDAIVRAANEGETTDSTAEHPDTTKLREVLTLWWNRWYEGEQHTPPPIAETRAILDTELPKREGE